MTQQMTIKFFLVIIAFLISIGSAQQGLQLLSQVSWSATLNTPGGSVSSMPWYQPYIVGIGNPPITGDAGFVAVFKDPVTNYTWWASREWVGVVRVFLYN